MTCHAVFKYDMHRLNKDMKDGNLWKGLAVKFRSLPQFER